MIDHKDTTIYLGFFFAYIAQESQTWQTKKMAQPGKDDKNKSSTFPFSSIWIGSKGVTTRLHYDIPNNLFVQIKGRKTFYIYPPSLNLKFYPLVN